MGTQSEIPRSNDDKAKREKNKKRSHYKWVIRIFFISLIITAVLSFISSELLSDMNIAVAFIVLVAFILIGILFDIIGLAVATADESGFHSMAARKNKVGRQAVVLLKNAEKVSSFCNDVVGDICGVVSGSTGTAIAARLFLDNNGNDWRTLLLTSCIAALIVGGKAAGKKLAINKSESIVHGVSRVICVFTKK